MVYLRLKQKKKYWALQDTIYNDGHQGFIIEWPKNKPEITNIGYVLGVEGNQGTRLYRKGGYLDWSCSREDYLTSKGGLLCGDSREQEQERGSWSC